MALLPSIMVFVKGAMWDKPVLLGLMSTHGLFLESDTQKRSVIFQTIAAQYSAQKKLAPARSGKQVQDWLKNHRRETRKVQRHNRNERCATGGGEANMIAMTEEEGELCEDDRPQVRFLGSWDADGKLVKVTDSEASSQLAALQL